MSSSSKSSEESLFDAVSAEFGKCLAAVLAGLRSD